MSKQYVSDIIGDAYKSWKEGDQVIIATPTGSGKTTFVISQLLKEAMSHGKHVVYYCNRKVLHDQFEVQSKSLIEQVFGKDYDLTEEAVNYLHIFTYQGAEDLGSYPNARYKLELIPETRTPLPADLSGFHVAIRHAEHRERKIVYAQDIMFYIFDEAHYFVSDALIRHKTNFWCRQRFEYGVSVFLTATPKPLLCFLAKEGDLPLNNEFSHVFTVASRRTQLKSKYSGIQADVMDMLDSWKQQDKVDYDFVVSPNLQDAFLRRYESPLDRYFSYLNRLFDNAPSRPYYYRTIPDYSYIDALYFYDDDNLLEQISRTKNDKWMIFVDSEANGEGLLHQIEELELGSVAFLSSKRIKTVEHSAFIYKRIVEDQQFPCRILISTSVLDCGVNIIDPAVKHMAIICDNETTFLQMLGRKRVSEGERLQLYIRLFPYRTIHTRFYDCLDKLTFMIEVGKKNDVGYSYSHSYLTETQMNDILSEISSGYRKNLVCGTGSIAHVEPDGHIHRWPENKTNLDVFLDGLTYSKTAMLLTLSRLYDYDLAMKQYRSEHGTGKELADFIYDFFAKSIADNCPLGNLADYYKWHRYSIGSRDKFITTWNKWKNCPPEDGSLNFKLTVERDDFFFLKHQLSWIGKDYDPSCWLLGSEKRATLIEFLDYATKSEPLRQDDVNCEQRDFSLQCIKLMLNLPLSPKSLQRNKSRYGIERWPGINALNKWLDALNLPYYIDHDQGYRVNGKKKTRWIVKHKEIDTPSEVVADTLCD